MTTLLICGSREATPAMLNYAHRCACKAWGNGWSIIVGDAFGVDHEVAKAGVGLVYLGAELHIVGVTPIPRHKLIPIGAIYDELITHTDNWKLKYLERDRYMVDRADMVMAIWNGVSRGTKYTYDYALKQHKRAWLEQP